MKTLLTFLLTLLPISALFAQPHASTTLLPTGHITVMVHAGIELFTIVQLLAGKYPMPNKSGYAKETEAYRTHF